MLVAQTNLYADQVIDVLRSKGQLKKYSRAKKWRQVSKEEMRSFLALMFLMGIIKKPDIPMYWSTDPMLATPFFSSVMTRNRFQAIWSFFHVNDNAGRQEGCTDRLFKIRPLLDHLVNRFRDLFTPDKKLSLDEGMLKWRGRLRFRVYNPMKPTKYGIKSYILADPQTGYCWSMKPYSGQSSSVSDTVKGLLGRLAGKGHTLYMDNFYNSVALAQDLYANENTHVCGTLRSNRGEPAAMKNAKLEKGDSVAFLQNQVMVLAWQDKKTVKMVTTCHTNNFAPVQLRQKGHAERVSIMLNCS